MARSEDAVAVLIRGAGILIAGAAVLYGGFLLLQQLYYFLRLGLWEPMGLMTYLGAMFGWGWAAYPDDWFGFHALLQWLNAGFFIAAVGGLFGLWLAQFENN